MNTEHQELLSRYREHFGEVATSVSLITFFERTDPRPSVEEIAEIIRLDGELCCTIGYGVLLDRYLDIMPFGGEGEESEDLVGGTEEIVRAGLWAVIRAMEWGSASAVSIETHMDFLCRAHPRFASVIRVVAVQYANELTSKWEDGQTTTGACEDDSILGMIGETETERDNKNNLTKVGRYQILHRLNKGSFGTVYSVSDEEDGKLYALKVYFGAVNAISGIEMCRQEYENAKSLEHDAFITAEEYGFFRDETLGVRVPFLVTELVPDAKDILEYVKSKHLGRDRILSLFMNLCEAVRYLHYRNRVHGDLKPANILISGDEKLKIIDFGFTTETLTYTMGELGHVRPRTRSGTDGFRPPESYDQNVFYKHREQHDVYSLGAILCLLLTKELPREFPSKKMDSTKKANYLETTPPRFAQRIPRGLRAIVCKAVAGQPADRYSDVSSLMADVEAFRQNLPLKATRGMLGYRVSAFVRRNPYWSIAGITVLGVLITVAGIGVAERAERIRLESAFAGLAAEKVRVEEEAALELDRVRDDFDSLITVIEGHLSTHTPTQDIPSKRFIRWVRAEDSPDGNDRVVILSFDGNTDSSTLMVYDRNGTEQARLGGQLKIPLEVSAAYRSDPKPRIIGGLVEDVLPDHPGKELVLIEQHRRMYPAVMRIYRLDRLDTPLSEVWHAGQWHSICWNQDEGLLVLTAASNKIADAWPELAAWDTAWCDPRERIIYPTVLIALDPKKLPSRSVLPPRLGSVELPPTPVSAMYALPHLVQPRDMQEYGVGIRHVKAPSLEGGLVDVVLTFRKVSDSKSIAVEDITRTMTLDGRWMNIWHSQSINPYKPDIQLPEYLMRIEVQDLYESNAAIVELIDQLHDPLRVREALRASGKELDARVDRVLSAKSRSSRWLYQRAFDLVLDPSSTSLEHRSAVELTRRARVQLPVAVRSDLVHAVRCTEAMALERAGSASADELLGVFDRLEHDEACGPVWRGRIMAFRIRLLLKTDRANESEELLRELERHISETGWIAIEDHRDVMLYETVRNEVSRHLSGS